MNKQLIQFLEFYDKMDWEGGIEGIIRHGHNGSGFSNLDDALTAVEEAMDTVDNLIFTIQTKYKDEIKALRETEDDE